MLCCLMGVCGGLMGWSIGGGVSFVGCVYGVWVVVLFWKRWGERPVRGIWVVPVVMRSAMALPVAGLRRMPFLPAPVAM